MATSDLGSEATATSTLPTPDARSEWSHWRLGALDRGSAPRDSLGLSSSWGSAGGGLWPETWLGGGGSDPRSPTETRMTIRVTETLCPVSV